eukprot:NODE_182_length_13754_cov_0.678067.p5 type:complete len:320 gc:universal NODE_182_length_13754_cov_0.678067:4872-3913(-)
MLFALLCVFGMYLNEPYTESPQKETNNQYEGEVRPPLEAVSNESSHGLESSFANRGYKHIPSHFNDRHGDNWHQESIGHLSSLRYNQKRRTDDLLTLVSCANAFYDARVRYTTLFEIGFNQYQIVNLDAAYPVNSMYYLAKWIPNMLDKITSVKLEQYGPDYTEIDRVVSSVIGSFNLLDERFTQGNIYPIVMIALFRFVLKNDFRSIPKLLIRFVIVFFLERPTDKIKQIKAIKSITAEFNDPGLGSQYSKLLPRDFYDPFMNAFKPTNPNVINLLPLELIEGNATGFTEIEAEAQSNLLQSQEHSMKTEVDFSHLPQ